MTMQAKEIKSKINSVENIKKITHAMEVVSVSKMKKATRKVTALRTYAQLALEILAHIAQTQAVSHELLEYGDGTDTLVLFVGADRGLCGSYNDKIARKVDSYVQRVRDEDRECEMITIGSRATRKAQKLDANIVGTFDDFSETIGIEEIGGLHQLVMEEFESGDYNNVVAAYTHHISALKSVPRIRQLLPITPKEIEKMVEELEEIEEIDGAEQFGSDNLSQYIFEPSQREVLAATLPQLTKVRIFRALLESFASEHSARMMAMKNATENAEEMIDDLNLSYNRARQANITREISEIAAGAEALSEG